MIEALYDTYGRPMKRVLGKMKYVSPDKEKEAEHLAEIVKGIPSNLTTPELTENSKFWIAMDSIVKVWSKIDPQGLKYYADNIKSVRDSQWDRRYASTKDKSLRWRARFPFMLIAIIKRLFPNFSMTEEFGRRFVARYRTFQVGEKS